MTADLHGPLTIDDRRLELDLQAMFRVGPPADLTKRMDQRIETSIRTWDQSAVRPSRRRPGRRAALVGLLAAALAVGGATGNLQALYLFVAGPFDVPWHRGDEIALSQVVDGYRVTINRAYADATRLALAISVVDEEERPGTTQLMAMFAVVTDVDGEYSGMGATSRPDGPFAAVNVAWKVPASLPLPSGPRTFHVVIPHIMIRDNSIPPLDADAIDWWPWHEHPGPWTFDFELDVEGGTTIAPGAAAEVDGVTVRVSRVIAASGIVRVEARVEGAPDDEGWVPIGRISHGRNTAAFVVSSLEDDGSVVLFTDDGLGDGPGEWTVTIDELAGTSERLAGPWVLTFNGP
jgi:hypothetical protein